MIEYLNELFSHIDPLSAYLVLFVSAFVENTFPPIPGDTVTVLGAYLITTGYLDFWGVYFSTTFGSVLGFFTMYMFGYRFGRSFIKSRMRARYFSDQQIQKVEIWFARWGYWVIAANRFLSGTRSVISLFAGLFHLKWYTVLILATISALIWNGLLIYGGYLLGVNWQMISTIIGQYNKIVLVLTLVLIIAFVVRRQRKKKAELKQEN